LLDHQRFDSLPLSLIDSLAGLVERQSERQMRSRLRRRWRVYHQMVDQKLTLFVSLDSFRSPQGVRSTVFGLSSIRTGIQIATDDNAAQFERSFGQVGNLDHRRSRPYSLG